MTAHAEAPARPGGVVSEPAPAGRRRRRVPRIGTWLLGSVIALLFILPLWWTVASALRPQQETFSTVFPVTWWTLIPRDVTLDNFTRLFETQFARAMLNSMIVTAVTVVGGLAICATAAFALAVMRFPGRTVFFAVMVVSFQIPFDAIAIPLMSIFRGVHLENSYLALILPGIGNGFAVFLLRGFFMGVPPELAQAARVDGLGWWGSSCGSTCRCRGRR